MALPKPTRLAGLSLVTVAAVGGGAVAAFTAGAAGGSGGTLTARYAKTADWGTGFQAEYTISNGTGHPVHGWTVTFDLPAGERISSLWDGTMTAAGQHVTVTKPAWSGDIATGTSASFGFVVDAAATGSVAAGSVAAGSAPRNCLINGASCSDGASDSVPALAPGATIGGSSPATSSQPATAPSPAAAPSSTTVPPLATASSSTAAPPSASKPPTSTSTVPPPSSAADSSSAYRFAPYVDTSQRQDLGALASAAGVEYLTAAFVLSGSGCTPAWNGSSQADFAARLKAGLAELRAQGGDAVASFGGANGTELALGCTEEAGLKAAYRSVIDEYGFTRLDFDIEGAAGTDKASMIRRWQVLAQLQNEYAAAGKTLDIALTLPALPSGLTPQGLDAVSAAVASGLKLSLVNILAMDYGDWAAPNPAGRMGQFAEQAAQSLHDQLRTVFPAVADDQLWAMVGITPMIGANDTAGETFQIADAEAIARFAAQHHIGRLAMWSLTRDAMCPQPSQWAIPACSSIKQGEYEFSHAFAAFTG